MSDRDDTTVSRPESAVSTVSSQAAEYTNSASLPPGSSSYKHLLGLPSNVQAQICQKLSEKDLINLTVTAKGIADAANSVLYRTITLYKTHEIGDRSPLTGLLVGVWTGITSGASIVRDPNADKRTPNRKQKMLNLVQVLHLKSCGSSYPQPHGSFSFPDLRVLHKSSIEPCESKNPTVPACDLFEHSKSPHLETLVLHNGDLAKTWQEYCSGPATWYYTPPWTQVKRIVWACSQSYMTWSEYYPAKFFKKIRSGETLNSFNIVFPPKKGLSFCPYLVQPGEDGVSRLTKDGEILAATFAKICASEVGSVVIAGVESLGEPLYLPQDSDQSRDDFASEQMRMIQDRTMLLPEAVGRRPAGLERVKAR